MDGKTQYEQLAIETDEGVILAESSGTLSGVDDPTAEGALEAILFSMGDPVPLSRLAEAVGLETGRTKTLLCDMARKYEDASRGIRLLDLDGSWQLCTKKQYFEQLTALAKQAPRPRLTDVMIETLAIVAYRQPVTKAEIERIRGVKSDHAVNRLVEYELIREAGRLDAPGRPILFSTTDRFLRWFGLSGKDELPEMSAVKLEDLRAEAEAEADSESKEEGNEIRVGV